MVFGFISLARIKRKRKRMMINGKTYFVIAVFFFLYSFTGYAQINFCGEPIPLNDKQVQNNFLNVLYKIKGKTNPRGLLKRAKKYFPFIEEMLFRYNIPQDFKYLPVIESGIYNYPQNEAGAAGAWSITESTARSLGLKVGNGVDERMDFEKATLAAIKFIRWLYSSLGSWTLAAAAYNGGLSRIQEKIKKSEDKDYYKLRLCKETAEYVLKVVTIKELFENHLDIDALADKITGSRLKDRALDQGAELSMVDLIQNNVSSTVSKKQFDALFNSQTFDTLNEESLEGKLIGFQNGKVTVKIAGCYLNGEVELSKGNLVIRLMYKETPWESFPMGQSIPEVIKFKKQ